MNRQFEIHGVREEFILVLFVDKLPITTLTGPDTEDLIVVGQAWVDAQFQAANRSLAKVQANQLQHSHVQWDGFERRKAPRHAWYR